MAFLLLALSAIGLKAQQNPILPGFHAEFCGCLLLPVAC